MDRPAVIPFPAKQRQLPIEHSPRQQLEQRLQRSAPRVGAGLVDAKFSGEGRFGNVSKKWDTVQCRTARTRGDLTRAFELLQQRYANAGLASLQNARMRIMPYHLHADSQVFVAETLQQIVGTVTLVQGNQQLPAAGTYPDAIDRLANKANGGIGEITSLAVDSSRVRNVDVFAKLTSLLTFFAREQGIEYLVAVVHPRHAKFYEHAMGFKVIGRERSYEAVNGNPGIAVAGEVGGWAACRPRWRSYYFDSDFSPLDLRPRPIAERDVQHFSPSIRQSPVNQAA